jgi:hypothetical protein
MKITNSSQFFVGGEVANTPAFSKRTLFVVGQQDTATIEKYARENRTTHIFLGANNSFDADPANKTWDKTITALLDKGFWVTLNYPAHQHETVLRMLNDGIWQCRTFVPLLSISIPKLETSNANLTVSVEDSVDVKGLWCLHFTDVTDSNKYTALQDYSIVVSIDGDTPIPMDPMFDTVKQQIETVLIDEPVKEQLNNSELGLDVSPTSSLKEEVKETVTPQVAAEAYADGATTDPLSKNAKVKGKK